MIGRIWLREQVTRQTWLAIFIGFIGVFVFLNPVQMTLSPVIGVAFCAAVLAAFTKTLIRQMSGTESTSKIVFYFASISTVLSAIPLIWLWQSIAQEHWLGLAAIGVFATAGQLGMTKAFSLAPAASVGVFTYSSVISPPALGISSGMSRFIGTWHSVPSSLWWRAILPCVTAVAARYEDWPLAQ